MDARAPIRTTETSLSRIVIGLIEHIGDIVACEPVARYLKLNHPNDHLCWVVRPEFREIIDTNPYIDETITVDCLTDWMKLAAHGAGLSGVFRRRPAEEGNIASRVKFNTIHSRRDANKVEYDAEFVGDFQ